jgi:hypothetical protein
MTTFGVPKRRFLMFSRRPFGLIFGSLFALTFHACSCGSLYPLDGEPEKPTVTLERVPTLSFAKPRADHPYQMSDETAARLAALPGIISMHHDLLVQCSPHPTDEPLSTPPTCGVGRLDSSGAFLFLIPHGVRSAFRVPGERMLVWNTANVLYVVEPDGEEIVLARNAHGPDLSLDGERVVFNLLPEGVLSIDPTVECPIVVADLRSGKVRVATEMLSAHAGVLLPGTDDVLYVSDTTGVASFWLASPGKPDRQLTNRWGKKREITPIFSDQYVWIPGTRKLVFTSRREVDKLWVLDTERGDMELLGPGRLPALDLNGGVVSALDGYPVPIARYLQPGCP